MHAERSSPGYSRSFRAACAGARDPGAQSDVKISVGPLTGLSCRILSLCGCRAAPHRQARVRPLEFTLLQKKLRTAHGGRECVSRFATPQRTGPGGTARALVGSCPRRVP